MFLGTHTPRLDEKGRIILPARFADDLADGVVLTRGQERCVYLFSAAEFAAMHESIRQARLTDAAARSYLRVFLSGAEPQTPDKQRRITVPPTLRAYAGLERDLAVLGVGDRVEIWDQAAWTGYLDAHEDSFADISGEVIPGIL